MFRKLAFFGLLILLSACSRDRIVIEGTLGNAGGKMLYLEEMESTTIVPVDSMEIKSSGRFRFVYPAKQPQFLVLRTGQDDFLTLLGKPGETIRVESEEGRLAGQAEVTGSEESLLVQQLENQLSRTKAGMDSLRSLYNALDESAETADRKQELQAEFNRLVSEQRRFNIRFIIENLQSLASFMAIYQRIEPEVYVLNSTLDLQYMKILGDSLSKYYPNSKYTRALKTDLGTEMGRMREARIREMISQMESTPLDVALPGTGGDTLRLSSMRGHYTLLNFWSPFHPESMEENKEIFRFYNRYRPKGFRVFQVAFDSSPELVQRITEYEGYPWAQVIDTTMENSLVARTFLVRELPANFLVSPEGEFIDRNLFGDALRQKLSQIYD